MTARAIQPSAAVPALVGVPASAAVPAPDVDPAIQVACQRRAALGDDTHLFERALAAPAADAAAWRQRVGVRLSGLRGAFAEHVVVTEGPDGPYAELLDQAPWLARTVQLLIREHVTVDATMSALQRRIDLPEVTIEELRDRAGELLRELSRHRQRGADLVYQAYQLDLGGET